MNTYSKLKVQRIRNFLYIGVSIILLTGLVISSNIQLDVFAQNNNNGIDQEIQDIVKKVATTNPDIKTDNLSNLLSALFQTLIKSGGQEKAKEEIHAINFQVTQYPKGIIVQSLDKLTKQLVSSSPQLPIDKNITPIINQILQEKSQSKNISQAIVNTTVKFNKLNQKSSEINQLLTKSSQILSKEGKVSPALAESILKQLYLQTAKSKGIVLADQSIKKIADILTKQPKGDFTKSLVDLVKISQNDLGTNSQLINTIKQIVNKIGTTNNQVSEKTTNKQSQQQSHQYTSNACPAKNVQHWDKIVFVIKSADLAKRLKLPANSELDIKVLDDPTKVADLKKNVLNFLKVPNEPRSSIEILQVKYAMICVVR